MVEIRGNIWEIPCDWLCITTNGVIRHDGAAVMGKGIALEAKKRNPDLPYLLADSIYEKGNVVSCLCQIDGKWIISFPTKWHWKGDSDPFLIEKSAEQLRTKFDEQKIKPIVILPRPGCGNGNLKWIDIKSRLDPILDHDNFKIVSL